MNFIQFLLSVITITLLKNNTLKEKIVTYLKIKNLYNKPLGQKIASEFLVFLDDIFLTQFLTLFP